MRSNEQYVRDENIRETLKSALPEEMKEDMHKIEPCSGHLKSRKEGPLPEEMKEDVHKIESCAGHLKSQKEGVVPDERHTKFTNLQ